MTSIFVRSRNPKPTDIISHAFFQRFGPDTASVARLGNGEYRVTTYADLRREKRERQAERLRRIRQSDLPQVRPIYVWVFHCPGFVFGGWWTWLKGRDWESDKYFWRHRPEMEQAIMDLFPMDDQPDLFGRRHTREQWQRWFARKYCCRHPDGRPRLHARRIQGKAFAWAEFDGQRIVKIIKPIP